MKHEEISRNIYKTCRNEWKYAKNFDIEVWSTLNVKVTALTTFEIAEIFIKAAHGLKLPPVQISAKSVKNYDNSSR